MKLISFCFYGASVTEQSNIDGYVYHLTKKIEEYFSNQSTPLNFCKISFPSAHFNDAGFSHVDSILSVKPNFVFLDWLSTDEEEFDISKLKYFLTRLLRNSIFPIFLDLPRADSLSSRRLNSSQAKTICNEMNIKYIDITESVINESLDIQNITRDGVHTSELGALFYAKNIFTDLPELFSKENPFLKCMFNTSDENKYSITKVSIPGKLILDEDSIMIIGVNLLPVKGESFSVEVWANQIVGTHSPIVEISCAAINFYSSYSIWDIWSHYDRLAYKPLIPKINIENLETNHLEFKVRISKTKPNYDGCRRDGIIFPEKLSLLVSDYFYSVNCSATIEIVRI